MKKILATLILIMMIISLAACGKGKNQDFSGTWKTDHVEHEGANFTVEEWANMDNEDFSDNFIVFKDGGKAYVYDDGYGDLVDWLQSEDEIMIGSKKCAVVDGMICFEYYGEILYLKKTSDSQEIPKEEKEDPTDNEELSQDEDSATEETAATEAEKDSLTDEPGTAEPGDSATEESNASEKEPVVDDAEWKQFLKDYEAWVDDYIALVKKYKANPTDLTILSDYTKMAAEMSDWSARADDIELELKDTEAALEYSAELLRIAGKLADVA